MSLIQTIDETEYPETDGKPMGETDLHIDWIIRVRDILRLRYRGQRVYVASNLIVYYEEGTPYKHVVPDGFVVLDGDPRCRRTYKLWEDGKPPDVVFEITSRGSKREDESFKPDTYARIGVAEYFLYDPEAEYLVPPLQGFRLEGDGYRRIQPADGEELRCERLGITLRRENGNLVIYDTLSGKVQRTEAEAEQTAREAAESRAEALQAELNRLRAELQNRRATGAGGR